jgi:hypothetical protein
MTNVVAHARPLGFPSPIAAAKSPAVTHRRSRRKSPKQSIEFRLIFALTFVFFLGAALLERLMPWRWIGSDASRRPRASIFKEARETAGTCTTYAFMG